MADAWLNISQGKLKLDIKNIQKDFSHFQEYFDTRMDILAKAEGIPDNAYAVSEDHPYSSSLVWAPGLG